MRHNYLNNKDILKEIHKSKNTYCTFTNPAYADYDMILPDVGKINKKNIMQARRDRAERLTKLAHETAFAETGVKRKLDEFEVKLKDVKDTDVVFRVMTWDHVPVDDAKSRKAALKQMEEDGLPMSEYDDDSDIDISNNTKYVKCNFPPFHHYMVNDEGTPVCVGKSHWRGDLETGEWSRDHGAMTKKLAHMFMKLCER